MGLDIYVVEKAHAEQNIKHHTEWEELHNRKEKEGWSEERWNIEREKITPYESVSQDAPSEIDPGHLFNKRYLRSSYNSGGWNSVVPRMLGAGEVGSLYWVFEPLGREWDGDEGLLTEADFPGLNECRLRVLELANMLEAMDGYDVMTVEAGYRSVDTTAEQALATFREIRSDTERTSSFSSWSGGDVPLYCDRQPVPIHAVFFGRQYGSAAAHLIISSQSKDGRKYYTDGAKILLELLEEMRMLIKRDGCVYMSWSG